MGLVCEADDDAELKLSPLYELKGRVEEGDSDGSVTSIYGWYWKCRDREVRRLIPGLADLARSGLYRVKYAIDSSKPSQCEVGVGAVRSPMKSI